MEEDWFIGILSKVEELIDENTQVGGLVYSKTLIDSLKELDKKEKERIIQKDIDTVLKLKHSL